MMVLSDRLNNDVGQSPDVQHGLGRQAMVKSHNLVFVGAALGGFLSAWPAGGHEPLPNVVQQAANACGGRRQG